MFRSRLYHTQNRGKRDEQNACKGTSDTPSSSKRRRPTSHHISCSSPIEDTEIQEKRIPHIHIPLSPTFFQSWLPWLTAHIFPIQYLWGGGKGKVWPPPMNFFSHKYSTSSPTMATHRESSLSFTHTYFLECTVSYSLLCLQHPPHAMSPALSCALFAPLKACHSQPLSHNMLLGRPSHQSKPAPPSSWCISAYNRLE